MSLDQLASLFAPPPAPAPEPDHFREQFDAEEWHYLERHPDARAAYRSAYQTRREREAGTIPASYTAATNCRGCGPVAIWPGAPAHVQGCPWCMNRASGRPIPRPRPTPKPAEGGAPTCRRTVAHEPI